MAKVTILKNENCEWIDVENATKEDLIYLNKEYKINELLLEDTVDSNHLPKYEEDENLKFFLMRENTELRRKNLNTISDVSTKLSVFISGKTIITVHRLKNKSIYETKKEMLLNPEKATTDKIALQLALKVIKSFDDEASIILDEVDHYENQIFNKQGNNSPNLLRELFLTKRKSSLNTRILHISSTWVDQYKILNISDAEYTNLKDNQSDAIADFEHINSQIVNLISMFLALTDQRANQTMNILTKFSVYFMPITFIAGLYGMNFKYMPELEQPYGYYATILVMLIIVIFTFLYFKRRKL